MCIKCIIAQISELSNEPVKADKPKVERIQSLTEQEFVAKVVAAAKQEVLTDIRVAKIKRIIEKCKDDLAFREFAETKDWFDNLKDSLIVPLLVDHTEMIEEVINDYAAEHGESVDKLFEFGGLQDSIKFGMS